MNKQDIRNYTFSSDDRLFFDANIWLYTHGPLVNKQNFTITKTYATALQNIRHQKSHLFIDALVLSEFINAYARLEYQQRNSSNLYKNFKLFRQSPDFTSVAQDIADNAKRIVKRCQQCDLSFSTLNLMNLLDEYAHRASL